LAAVRVQMTDQPVGYISTMSNVSRRPGRFRRQFLEQRAMAELAERLAPTKFPIAVFTG
jgi:hypothetical protein